MTNFQTLEAMPGPKAKPIKPATKNTMPRISKVELARRAETQVRVEHAKRSLLGAIGKLLDKHLPALTRNGVESAAEMDLKIDAEGNASLAFQYQTTVRDGASFALDDGQPDLPLPETGANQNTGKNPGPDTLTPPGTQANLPGTGE